jgi:hypothetical protein
MARRSTHGLDADQLADQVIEDLLLAREVCARIASRPALTLTEVCKQYGLDYLDSLMTQLLDGQVASFIYRRSLILPSFQFNKNGLIPTVACINEALDAANDPFGVVFWWTEPHGRLAERAPVDLLYTGSPAELRALLALARATSVPRLTRDDTCRDPASDRLLPEHQP